MTLPPLLALRLAKLLAGVFLYGLAMSLMVRAGLGVAPWDVLTLGLVHQTGLSFGLLTILIGVAVLLLWWPLRQRLGLGTALNALLVGPSAQFGLWLLPDFGIGWQQVLVFTSGLLLLALATGLYIGARFGPGPRDGLMTGLHARFGWPIWAVRTGIEGSVLLAGWWMGGTVGLGTVAFAVLIGPLVGRALPWCDTRMPVVAQASPA
ncbi:membrane protein YczE [Luteimonas sp. A482]